MGTVEGSGNDPDLEPKPDSKKDDQLAEEDHPSCPKCGSQDVRRSSSEGVGAALLRVFGRWPFRCRSCRARFYRAAPPPEDD
jgi:ribosomal protein L37AE/L43A